MPSITLATFGSLGDLHPKIAIGLELKNRGHGVTIAAMNFYREKIAELGLGFAPLAPHLDPNDKELAQDFMDARKGSEKIIRDVIMVNLQPMYDDLLRAVEGSQLLVTGEIVYAVRSVVEKTDIKWVSTTLQPGTFFSAHDPFVPPAAEWIEYLRPLGPSFHRAFFGLMRRTISDWYRPYKEFRRGLGLSEDHDPIFDGKYSQLLHLALFSKALGLPQPDWPANTVQTGFCFYDGHTGFEYPPDELIRFLDDGLPPMVFTLGSAAVMDPGSFFDESAKAAKLLGRRAVLLYGTFNEPPVALNENIIAIPYAPYSQVFPRASCIIHQGGVGTTGQALRAGVPQLIMPYGHDQPDNAARCRRAGVALSIGRSEYNAENAARKIEQLLTVNSFSVKALGLKEIVMSEGGAVAAADALEQLL